MIYKHEDRVLYKVEGNRHASCFIFPRMHSRLSFFLARAARKSSSSLSSARSPPLSPNPRLRRVFSAYNNKCNAGDFFWLSHSHLSRNLIGFVTIRREFCGYAAEQFSDDEYECDYENHPVIFFSLSLSFVFVSKFSYLYYLDLIELFILLINV